MKLKGDRQQAAALLRRILAAVERGEIEADSPAARRILRRLDGAVAAWEVDVVTPLKPSSDKK